MNETLGGTAGIYSVLTLSLIILFLLHRMQFMKQTIKRYHEVSFALIECRLELYNAYQKDPSVVPEKHRSSWVRGLIGSTVFAGPECVMRECAEEVAAGMLRYTIACPFDHPNGNPILFMVGICERHVRSKLWTARPMAVMYINARNKTGAVRVSSNKDGTTRYECGQRKEWRDTTEEESDALIAVGAARIP